MTKKLNTTQIENELKTGSSYFNRATPLSNNAKSKTRKKSDANQTKTASTVETNDRTVGSNGSDERSDRLIEDKDHTVIDEVVEGRVEEDTRPTKRHSFEAYVDQIEAIEDVQYQFKKRTGKKLSSSRLIREALDNYINQLKTLIEDEKEQQKP